MRQLFGYAQGQISGRTLTAGRWHLPARVSRLIAIPLATIAFVWVGYFVLAGTMIVAFPGSNDASITFGVVFLLISLPGALAPALLLFASKYDYDSRRFKRSFYLGLPSVVLAILVWAVIFLAVGSLLEDSR